MQKSTKTVIIIAVIVLAIFFLPKLTTFNIQETAPTQSGTPTASELTSEINIVSSYTSPLPSSNIFSNFMASIKNLFAIRTDKAVYAPGDTVRITENINLDTQCNSLKATFNLYKTGISGVPLRSKQIIVANNIGFSCVATDTTITGTTGYDGIYWLETIWTCDNVLVYNDGTCGGTNTQGRISQVKITFQTGTPPTENLCTVRNCDYGQVLVNANLANCFCRATWTEGDGVCAGGEPTSSIDCQQSSGECTSGQILQNGVCVSKSAVCEKLGGTKNDSSCYVYNPRITTANNTCMELTANTNVQGVNNLGSSCSTDASCKSGYCNTRATFTTAVCDVPPGANNYVNTLFNVKDLNSQALFPEDSGRRSFDEVCKANYQCASGYCKFGGVSINAGLCDKADTPNVCKSQGSITNPDESSSGTFDFFDKLAFFKITGNKTTDGIIILAGFIGLLILFSSIGRKK